MFRLRPRRGGAATSLSDRDDYTRVCRKASRSDRAFASFRRHPAYTRILEHVDAEQGRAYLALIRERTPHLLDHVEAFRRNDRHGGPATVDYAGVGRFSPTTLRYVKVLGDLESLFGDLSGLDVIEIGGGYGGQCNVIAAYRGFRSYTIVDLEPALALARRFLGANGVTDVAFRSADALADGVRYGLAISNYAFTECSREVQELYLRRVLEVSQRGYLTGNRITPDRYRSLGKAELADRLGARELPEEPLSHPDNYLLVWERAVRDGAAEPRGAG